MKNKIATILTSAIIVLTTNNLPSYALSEYSVASLPKQSQTQTNPKPQLTEEAPARPPEAPPRARCSEFRRVYNYRLKKWVYVMVYVSCGSRSTSPSSPSTSPLPR